MLIIEEHSETARFLGLLATRHSWSFCGTLRKHFRNPSLVRLLGQGAGSWYKLGWPGTVSGHYFNSMQVGHSSFLIHSGSQ